MPPHEGHQHLEVLQEVLALLRFLVAMQLLVVVADRAHFDSREFSKTDLELCKLCLVGRLHYH